MTKITIDRALVEQALEALEVYATHRGLPGPCPVRNVEYALRAALAQQAEPVAVAERERIAEQWDGCVTHQLDTFGPVDIGASIRAGELVEPAQQAEPVEPVQEPAGYWDGKFKFGASILYEVPQQSLFGFKYCNEPLYTAPLQRKSVEGEKK
jgi:hypothetical protein